MLTCNKPDRHVPGIICGYPLPCPFHTAIIEITGDRVKVDVPRKGTDVGSLMKTTIRLTQIGRAISDGLTDQGR